MNETFMNLTLDNLDTEHICCAISDKKHQVGVSVKKQWLKKRGCLFLEKIICIFTVFG